MYEPYSVGEAGARVLSGYQMDYETELTVQRELVSIVWAVSTSRGCVIPLA
jgi:hypothetical protein